MILLVIDNSGPNLLFRQTGAIQNAPPLSSPAKLIASLLFDLSRAFTQDCFSSLLFYVIHFLPSILEMQIR